MSTFRIGLLLFCMSLPVARAADVTLVHQGRVVSASGEPVEGPTDLRIRLWSAPVSSAPADLRFDELFPAQVFDNGMYSVTLGSTVTLDSSLFEENLWVGVTVGTTELSPRQPVATAPRAVGLSTGKAFPTGMIAFFTGACPAGFSEYAPARGRVIVSVAPTGNTTVLVGNALMDRATRTITEVPAHSHTVDPPSTSTSTDPHTHTYGDYYWEDSGNTDLYGTPSGDGVGIRAETSRILDHGGTLALIGCDATHHTAQEAPESLATIF